MGISKMILNMAGWKVNITIPDVPKSIICVAPHTSNWDFILGKLAYASIGRKAGFLMKSTWFFFPLGYLFKAMGGIPVVRKGKQFSLVDYITELYKSKERLTLAITPEGTRKATSKWRTGFLRIALNADVPIFLGILDYEHKSIIVTDEFIPSGNIEEDLKRVKDYYKGYKGKYPEKFSTDYEQ